MAGGPVGRPGSAVRAQAVEVEADVGGLGRRAGERDKRLGTYHLSASGQCTWFDFAEAIFARARTAGLIERVPRLVPIATSDYPTPARRPAYSVLDCSKIDYAFGIFLPPWQDGLNNVIGELAG